MKRKKSATLSQRRKAWNTPALRQLGSHEKEDIAQIVFSYYATREAVKIAIDRLYNDRKALSPSDFEAMASIFRSVRKTLRMNDTASRKEDSCDHTTLQALEEMGELDITESNPSSPRLAMLNMMIAKLKAQAVEAEKNHPSRKSKAMLATHLETIDRIEALQNPFSKDCEPMEQGAWRVRIKRLASFLYPCGFQVNLGELMEDMTNLA